MSKLSRGSNTPKYSAVKASIDPLANACKDDLTRVATLLFGKSLINDGALEKARNATQPTYDRSSDLMTSVLRKIEKDEANYDLFISELSKMSELDTVIKRLEEARREYEHSSAQQQLPPTNPNPNTGQGPGHSGEPGNLQGPTTGGWNPPPQPSYPPQGAAGYGPSAPNGRAISNGNTPHGGTDSTAQVSPTVPGSSRSPPELPLRSLPGQPHGARKFPSSVQHQQPSPSYHPPPPHPHGSGPGIGAPPNLSKTSYEYYVSCIPVQHRSKLDCAVDFENNDADLHLGEIADELEDWEDVAPALGLTGLNISDIQDSIQRISQRRRAALRKWKSSHFGYQSTYGSLLRIFTTNRRFKCAEKIVQQLGGTGNPTQAPPHSGSGGNAYGHPAEYTDGGGGASLPLGRQADYPGDRSRGALVKRQRLDHSAEFTLLNITRALKIVVPPNNYMTLGLSMGVAESAVRTIEQDYPGDSGRVLLEIASVWIHNITDPKPSWQELENVLAST